MQNKTTLNTLAEEFRKTPFLKLVIPFILGISLQMLFCFSRNINICFFLSTLVLLATLSVLKIAHSFQFKYFWGIALYMLLIGAGILLTINKQASVEIPESIYKSDCVVCSVDDIPTNNEESARSQVTISAFRCEDKWKECDVPCQLTINSTNTIFRLNPNEQYVIATQIQELSEPVCPYQFDFKKYLYYKGLKIRIKTDPFHIRKLKTPTHSFFGKILDIRQYLLDKFEDKNFDKREKSVLSSLLLGFTGNIDPELRNAFAVSGTMHILSVSGLHVGIVFIFLNYLFFFFDRWPKLLIIKSIIIIFGLWFYALIAGFSPPVIRSAAMFSLFAAGIALNRKGNSFNVLAASAFIILLCNPFQLADMGFQLSYVAMAGIFIFYEKIHSLLSPNLWIMKKIWELISASLAAQIGTLPLSFYYFHQFPTYFLLANIIIVPLSGFIIYAGLTLMIVSFWKWLATIVAFVLKYLLELLNWLVFQIDNLPNASIRAIYFDSTSAALLYCIILIMAIWIFDKNKNWLYGILGCLLILTSLQAERLINSQNQEMLIVYKSSHKTALSIIDGQKHILFADSLQIKYLADASTYMNTALNLKQFTKIAFGKKLITDSVVSGLAIHSFLGDNLIIRYSDKSIIVLNNNKFLKYVFEKPIKTDFLILPNSYKLYITKITKMFLAKRIIYASKNSYSINYAY